MNQCPVCKSTRLESFIEIHGAPVFIGVQWPTREEARNCSKGEIELAFCQDCGFITNLKYDPSLLEYSESYDNSLHFSPLYQEYAQSVAQKLIDTYEIRDKQIIEIGSGKGEFLTLLCRLGNNKGIGFDSSFEAERLENDAGIDITFIKDYYSEKYRQYQGDLICSRYVLEHVPDPIGFLSMIRGTIDSNRNPVVYFEVPNVNLFLINLSIWDIIYEHCSYFGKSSLASSFTTCGFQILELGEHYDGQMVSIESAPKSYSSIEEQRLQSDIDQLRHAVEHFEQKYREIIRQWRTKLAEYKVAGKKVVIWGTGAKGVSFLNMLDSQEIIEFAVDINPHKHDKFVPGSGQQIISPGFLQDYQPDIVIVMNPIYSSEIQMELEELGISPVLISV